MTRSLPFLLCICCIVSCLAVSTVCADYYSYTDSRGVVNLTNKLASVPARYRSSVKVIKEEPPKPAAQPAEPAAEQAPVPAPETSLLSRLARFPWVKPVLYLFLAAASFWGINRICGLLRSPQLAKVIYFAFFCGAIAFLYKTYTDQMAATFDKLKHDATAVVNQSKTRQPPKELEQ